MTGFGVGSAALDGGRITVEIRAVNGRFLDVRVRLPEELADLSTMVDGEARRALHRGRCDIGIRTEGNVFPLPAIDKERARAAYRALTELKDEIAPGAEVPFAMLSALPDLFVPSRNSSPETAEKAVRAALAAALEDLDRMRKREGRAIAEDLARRLEAARESMNGIAARAPELVQSQARRLHERLARISEIVADGPRSGEGRELPIDTARVEQEIVLFLERSDISEELTRLGSHVEQLGTYLAKGEPVGRKLDFLLQEMSREINTIGAKSQDLRTSHLVVELKAEVERMREQVQNVE
jgi:uncharacterized protein (TIGR00255 family)